MKILLHRITNTRHRRTITVVGCLLLCGFLLITCMNEPAKKTTNTSAAERQTTNTPVNVYEDFAGSKKCASCHKSIYESHIKSAHFLTSLPAGVETIKGSFAAGKNDYWYTPQIRLSMQKRDSGLYQVAYFKGEEKKAMRMDITTGSGAKGQSFLEWRGNKLFQLPITFFTAAGVWSNSPGYPAGKVMIDKPVTARCLECHVSFAQAIAGPPLEPLEFDKRKILYGVDCEKCHGAAAKHVAFQTENPNEKSGRFIINPAKFSRQQLLDMCAVCHGGRIDKIKPSFSFVAGNELSDFFVVDTLSTTAVETENVDVHGNQFGLMKASKCFKNGVTLTCNSCHSPHTNERGNKQIFSQRCVTCHNTSEAKFQTPSHSQIVSIEKNCIDCHMPAQPSRAINVLLQGEEVPRASLIRSHYVAIYPNEAKRFIDGIKRSRK